MPKPALARWLRRASIKAQDVASHATILSGMLAFKPRPDDVYLASYARSGTTWLQMIVYQLTTDGSMEFAHITEPIPYFERALSSGRDLEKVPSPRIFKTHCRYKKLPRGPYKRIYIARNGKDVLVSCYYFFRAHSPFKGTFDQFFRNFVVGNVQSGSWFRHVSEWSTHAADPNVLFIRYEDLVNHFERTVRRIADFLNIPLSPETYARVAERSSFQFMKQHEEKFGFLQEVLMEFGFTGGDFIRQGKSGSGKEHLNPEQEALFEQLASTVIMPPPFEATPRPAKS